MSPSHWGCHANVCIRPHYGFGGVSDAVGRGFIPYTERLQSIMPPCQRQMASGVVAGDQNVNAAPLIRRLQPTSEITFHI